MMDPRPEVSQDVDLTFLGVFSGYTNSHAMGHHTIPDHEREVDMTEWLTNKVDDPDVMVGIGFSNIPGDVVGSCDYIDLTDLTETVPAVLRRRRSTTHSIRPSSQIKKMHAELHDKNIENRIRQTVKQQDDDVAPNGCCVNCGQPLRIPKMLNALYPRAYISHGDLKYIVSRHDMCDHCATLNMIDILCGRDSESYSRPYNTTYDYSNNVSTVTYRTIVAYCDAVTAYTPSSIIPIVDHIEKHADRVSFYDNIAPLVTTNMIDSFGGVLQKKRALYQKLSNRFYNGAYDNVDLSHARIVKERLDKLVETIDDVWSTDVDGLKSALRVGVVRPYINVHKTTDWDLGMNLASLSSGYNTINHYRCDELVRSLSELLNLVLTTTYKSPTQIATTGEDYTSYIENAHWTTISTAVSTTNNITFVPNTNRYNTTITLYDDVHLI